MPPAVHPLLVGFVDPRTPSRLRYNDELKQALRNVTSVLPYEEMRDLEWFLLHSRHTLNHKGRLVGSSLWEWSFLVGNWTFDLSHCSLNESRLQPKTGREALHTRVLHTAGTLIGQLGGRAESCYLQDGQQDLTENRVVVPSSSVSLSGLPIEDPLGLIPLTDPSSYPLSRSLRPWSPAWDPSV
jgi:hypothetical protein